MAHSSLIKLISEQCQRSPMAQWKSPYNFRAQPCKQNCQIHSYRPTVVQTPDLLHEIYLILLFTISYSLFLEDSLKKVYTGLFINNIKICYMNKYPKFKYFWSTFLTLTCQAQIKISIFHLAPPKKSKRPFVLQHILTNFVTFFWLLFVSIFASIKTVIMSEVNIGKDSRNLPVISRPVCQCFSAQS